MSGSLLLCVWSSWRDVRVGHSFLPSSQSLRPGADNSLSSYMNQRSASGELWRRRWFVLTNRALICYDNHRVSEAALKMDGLFLLFNLPSITEARQDFQTFSSRFSQSYCNLFQVHLQLSLVPSPTPSFLTKSWAWDWERGYLPPPSCLHQPNEDCKTAVTISVHGHDVLSKVGNHQGIQCMTPLYSLSCAV